MKNRIHILATYILLALGSAQIAIAQDGTSDPNVEKLTIPFRNDSSKSVQVHVISGGITVMGYDGADVKVEASGHNRGSETEEEENGMKTLNFYSSGLFAEEEDNKINIGIRMGHHGDQEPIDLKIWVPFETSLDLSCINHGDILVENVTGELNVNNINGELTLKNISGAVSSHTVNGHVLVTFNKVPEDKPMSFISLNGNIDVSMPEDTKAKLKMDTFRGKIKTDFDITIQPQQTEPSITDNRENEGKYRIEFEKVIYGTINGGGPLFNFNTHHGNITIRKSSEEKKSVLSY